MLNLPLSQNNLYPTCSAELLQANHLNNNENVPRLVPVHARRGYRDLTHLSTDYLLSVPTQEDSQVQPQVHMEEVDQFKQEMVVRN